MDRVLPKPNSSRGSKAAGVALLYGYAYVAYKSSVKSQSLPLMLTALAASFIAPVWVIGWLYHDEISSQNHQRAP